LIIEGSLCPRRYLPKPDLEGAGDRRRRRVVRAAPVELPWLTEQIKHPKDELAAAVELAAGTLQMPRDVSALRRYLIDLLLDLFLGLPRQADEVKVVIFTSCQFFERRGTQPITRASRASPDSRALTATSCKRLSGSGSAGVFQQVDEGELARRLRDRRGGFPARVEV
jgi:hypothetical protein